MANVSVNRTINAAVDTVWATVSDFGGLTKWARGIDECTMDGEGVGAIRTLKTADGRTIVERLEALDNDARSLSYAITSEGMPFENYLATITVTADGDGSCKVDWGCTFDATGAPEDALVANFEKSYGGGLKGIAAHCEG